MFIKKIIIKNYRTIENIEVSFDGYYTAISGKNNAGKSNIIRALQCILSQGFRFRIGGHSVFKIGSIDWNNDITSWKKEKKEDIVINLTLIISKNSDVAIFKFLTELIFKDTPNNDVEDGELNIEVSATHTNKISYKILFDSNEVKEDYQKQEVLKRLQNTECLIFHNSTNSDQFNPFSDSIDKVTNFINDHDLNAIDKKKEELTKLVSKSLKHHETELSKLLGNLDEKYEVSLSTEGLNIERETINISLKERGANVSLDDWGSGTRNRTLIFLNLLNAKRAHDSANESDRVTPVVIIEEPECFLHPHAQAEFGRILQDIANQLEIQVITTTHSPYLLSFKTPESNILIERDMHPRSKDSSSHLVNTNTEEWYKPFAAALGLNKSDFGPMKDVIFSTNSKILLVEGKIDKEYFTFFQDKNIHKENALSDDIEVFPYDGADNIKNNILINFINKKFNKVVITIDLDRYDSVKKSVIQIGFEEAKNLFAIGKNEEGKKSIEGLLSQDICTEVFQRETDLVRRATNGADQKSAKNELKKKYLEVLKKNSSVPNVYDDFYGLIKKINKAFK